MISYHGHRPVGRTRFSIVVNPPRQPSLSHSTSRRPCFDSGPPSFDSSPPSFGSSPPDSGLVSLQPSLRVSDPDLDIRLPPPLVPLAVADCGPITPPPSSQVASRVTSPAVHPGSMLDRAEFSELLPPPSNWDELLHSITAYIDSGATLPATTHMDDALWRTFVADLDPGDRYSPLYRLRYTYEADTRQLIVRCMPAPEHDAIQSLFEHGISEMSRAHALATAERDLFTVKVGTDVTSFAGARRGSRKRADLSVAPQNLDSGEDEDDDGEDGGLNGDFPSVAVEVGFSEGYARLKQDMELWLLGSAGKVRVVVLVNLVEMPVFTGEPFSRDDAAAAPAAARRWVSAAPHGPIMYDGHVLVGAITGFVELWRIDAATALPYATCRRTVLPAPPDPRDPADDCFALTLADLFGAPERVPGRLDADEEVRFPFDVYRRVLARAIRTHGRQRLADAAARKRSCEGGDAEWVPEGDGRASKRRKA